MDYFRAHKPSKRKLPREYLAFLLDWTIAIVLLGGISLTCFGLENKQRYNKMLGKISSASLSSPVSNGINEACYPYRLSWEDWLKVQTDFVIIFSVYTLVSNKKKVHAVAFTSLKAPGKTTLKTFLWNILALPFISLAGM